MFQRTAGLLTLVLAVGVGSASAQGTFGHLAYGAGWQTTFLIVNQDQTTEANVSLSFYSDSGTPLAAPVNGNPTSVYSFNLPPSGSTAIVLPDVGGSTANEGWASLNVSNTPAVSGQAIFRQQLGGSHPVLEAAVPFNSGAPSCLVPYGVGATTHYILVPFDNTIDVHVTAFAFANTTSAAMSIPIEFDDPSGAAIATDTLNLAALNHKAFTSTGKYPATNGKSGVLRITLPGGANPGDLSVLALLADSVTGTLTTLMPIAQ
ncbi:MAG TPA: hypothetical protein VK335_34070 [Bryobacteraceae bacterium]|nr:hypothetical protein [Bryobacteraceae bacterium]